MKLIVGLDVSSTELDVCFLTDDDNFPVLKEASFENDQISATQIGIFQRFTQVFLVSFNQIQAMPKQPFTGISCEFVPCYFLVIFRFIFREGSSYLQKVQL